MKISVGAVVPGGSSLDYKTGDWRDQRPVLDGQLCNSCGICQTVCPDSAVHLVVESYEIDYDFCKGCGLCAYECPIEAILMVQEDK